ncbi:MFS transporter [Photobacterium halotolerans]|uniref:multidrug effflux MFS transporter n=1 Tax=Photobacterium halotolerans TaxID=265726 RepID=UPI00137316EF|nr:multidrug effflux MFS transporter [Photobacterium halotolerans]NAX46620.1 MFS transporter [Photobacterium halotolerans]
MAEPDSGAAARTAEQAGRSAAFSWRPILLACLTISIGQFGMGLVFPSLPWIAKDFGISIDQAQLLISVYLLGFGPSQFIYGPISDALGRRRVLLAGILLAVAGLILVILASDSFYGLVAGRLMQGLGAGCCAVLARASTRDSYTGEQLPQALSYLTMVASFTPIFAPVIGGFINHHFGWLSVFIVLASYITLVWFALCLMFKETMHDKQAVPSVRKIAADYRSLLASRYFLSFASIGWLNFSLVVTTISLMPFIMQVQIGMTSDEYALWALLPTAGLFAGGFLVSWLRPKIGTKRMLYLAPAVHLIAAVWLILAPLTPLMMMLGQFLMVFGNGIAMPCAQSQVMLPYRKQAGTVAALSGGGQMLLSALVSMALIKLGIQQAWQLGCVIGIFALIVTLNIRSGFRTPLPDSQ